VRFHVICLYLYLYAPESARTGQQQRDACPHSADAGASLKTLRPVPFEQTDRRPPPHTGERTTRQLSRRLEIGLNVLCVCMRVRSGYSIDTAGETPTPSPSRWVAVDDLLFLSLFNVLPVLLEILFVCAILLSAFTWYFSAITLACAACCIALPPFVMSL
jgi:hypothetical protein